LILRHILTFLQDRQLVQDQQASAIEQWANTLGANASSQLHRELVQRHHCPTEDIAQCWADLSHWDLISMESHGEVFSDYMSQYGTEYSRQNECVVLQKGSHYTFATLHPFNTSLCHEISLKLKVSLRTAIIDERQLNLMLEKSFSFKTDENQLQELEPENIESLQRELAKSDDLLDMANKAPVVKLVNAILFQALKQRGSDIHVQPYEREFVIRYRIDGILQDVMTLPKTIQDAFVSRLKVMGKMDIAERRLPQDGTTSFVAAGREVDVRVSSLPSIYGERIVMRLQDKSSGVKQLENIGLSPSTMTDMEHLLNMSHGIILVTGPTGAGKTTTLYAMLDRLNEPDINIITLEDPVELSLPGISQTQVSPKKGLSFAAGLRSIVRQDPDVIMVGEIRDLETASISIQSALTGHLVLSTLHTNDAISALTRLIDLGVEPAMINASILGVVAQRLVRTLCETCKQPHPDPKELLTSLSFDLDAFQNKTVYQEQGCEHCHNTGFMGRTALYEIFLLNQKVKNELHRDSSYQAIKDVASQAGFSSIRDDGIEKIKAGNTTPAEVFRVTQVSGF
jgi:general secretion pathway protein E